jgi:hypothetical protein
MRSVLMLAATALAMLGASASSGHASCMEAWSPVMKERPDVTCMPFTDRLLVSLQGATRAQVIKTMKNNGRLVDHDKVLHFMSAADSNSGDANFRFEGDTVTIIFAAIDSKSGGHPMEFIWNPNYSGPEVPCSDLPGSRYARCNE